MARITSPTFDGGTVPQAAALLLTAVANTNPVSNDVIVYNGGLITTPSFDQIVTIEDPPAVGYSTG